MIAPERLYLNRDKTAVVRDGHPDAGFLLAHVGNTVPPEWHSAVTELLEGDGGFYSHVTIGDNGPELIDPVISKPAGAPTVKPEPKPAKKAAPKRGAARNGQSSAPRNGRGDPKDNDD